jgi:hypothetical protein
MVLGSLCLAGLRLPPESVSIDGIQQGFLISFKVVQRFRNPKSTAGDISYRVPNNSKMCMYDTTFRLRGEVIKPHLHEKTAAQVLFTEAKTDGRVAILGHKLSNGLVEFELGNLPPNDLCDVEVSCGLVASSDGLDKLCFKFPLDTCTQSGSTQCAATLITGDFSSTLRNADPGSVSNISSNISGSFNSLSGTYSIATRVFVPAILISTSFKRPLASECLASGNFFAATAFVAELPKSDVASKEFVFLIDCSGSMSGEPIQKAASSLEMFIQSLPKDSFFNVVTFGSTHVKLFPESVSNTKGNVKCALDLAKHLDADLCGTDILTLLEAIWAGSDPVCDCLVNSFRNPETVFTVSLLGRPDFG